VLVAFFVPDRRSFSGVRDRDSAEVAEEGADFGGGLRDLASLARHERQEIYAHILREKQTTLTPGDVKLELERRGMTFAFVGQDMAAMRLMPFVSIEARGQYRWKNSFKGDLAQIFGKTRKHPTWGGGRKRAKAERDAFSLSDDEERQRALDDSEGSVGLPAGPRPGESVAQALFQHVRVHDEASKREKERAMRNLDMLLAIAQERDPEPEMSEVCGFRIRE
jgi:hypothetical protein